MINSGIGVESIGLCLHELLELNPFLHPSVTMTALLPTTTSVPENLTPSPHALTTERRSLFGIQIDSVNLPQAVEHVLEWINDKVPVCQFVVTPNVDHIVQLQTNTYLQQAYEQAGLILADGWPVVTTSRWLGQPLPARVPGSDLVPAIFDQANKTARPLRVYLLGAAEGVADRAAEVIHCRWPQVQVVGTYSPPLGFEKSDTENHRILERIAEAAPDLLVVGLGAPKQELWVAKHQSQLRTRVALCVGATIDFLAGEKRRAPTWVQALRLEWLHRLLSEPKRLAKRYWHDAKVFPGLVWREYRKQR